MGAETTDQDKKTAATLKAWQANRDKLLADTAIALKAMGFDAAALETSADERTCRNTSCRLTRGDRSDEVLIGVLRHSDKGLDWRSHRTEHVCVSVYDVTPRRTLNPTSKYVNGRLTYTPIKPETLAKVLAKAFDQRLANEADDKRRGACQQSGRWQGVQGQVARQIQRAAISSRA